MSHFLYMLMFGREAWLSVDLAFSTSLDQTSVISHRGYVDCLWQKIVYENAQAASDIQGQRNRRNYDLRVRVQDLQLGDRVLLRTLGVPGKHKLAVRWKSQTNCATSDCLDTSADWPIFYSSIFFKVETSNLITAFSTRQRGGGRKWKERRLHRLVVTIWALGWHSIYIYCWNLLREPQAWSPWICIFSNRPV